MNRIGKIAAAAALTAGLGAFATIPAQAAEVHPSVVQPMSKHTGSTGCFNWSWSDGNVSATVYYHNTCSTTAYLCVWWKTGNTDTMHRLKAGGGVKGHHKESGTIISQDIEDCT